MRPASTVLKESSKYQIRRIKSVIYVIYFCIYKKNVFHLRVLFLFFFFAIALV